MPAAATRLLARLTIAAQVFFEFFPATLGNRHSLRLVAKMRQQRVERDYVLPAKSLGFILTSNVRDVCLRQCSAYCPNTLRRSRFKNTGALIGGCR